MSRTKGALNKNKPFKAALQLRAMEVVEKDGTSRRRLDWIALALIGKAMEGDVPAIKEIGERLDGRASLIDGEDAASLLLASIKVMFINAGQDSNSGISEEAPLSIPAE